MRCYASEQILSVLYVLDNILNGGGLSVFVCAKRKQLHSISGERTHIFALPQGIN